MLAELTPDELVMWRAARHAVPLDDGWKQAGTIAAVGHNNFEYELAMRSGRSIEAGRLKSPSDFIPKLDFARKEALAVDQGSIDAHQLAMESRYLKK